MIRKLRWLPVLLLVTALLPSGGARAGHEQFQTGDVFVAVSDGKVQWRHPNGNLNETLDTGFPGQFTTGMGFDVADHLYVTVFSADAIVEFDADGSSIGEFGSGYDSNPESILFDAAGNAYVGQAGGTFDILKFDADGNFLDRYDVATEERGSDWIDLAADQCTMFYTSEGQTIFRYDVCKDEQLADFTNALPGGFAYALRLLPGGGLLVADSEEIHRLNSSGDIVQSYDAPGQDDWFALNFDPDGTSFWSADFSTSDVFKFDIDSGDVLDSFNTETGGSTVFGLTVAGEITVSQPQQSAKGHAHTEYDGDGEVSTGGDVHVLVDVNRAVLLGADSQLRRGPVVYRDRRGNPPGSPTRAFTCFNATLTGITDVAPGTVMATGDIECRSLGSARSFELVITDGGPNPPNQDSYAMTLFNKNGKPIYEHGDETTVGFGDLVVEEEE